MNSATSTARVRAQFVRKGDVVFSGVHGACRVARIGRIGRAVFTPKMPISALIYIPGGFMECIWYDDEWVALA